MAFTVISTEMKLSHTLDKGDSLVTKECWGGIRVARDHARVTTDWLTSESHLFLSSTALSSPLSAV